MQKPYNLISILLLFFLTISVSAQTTDDKVTSTKQTCNDFITLIAKGNFSELGNFLDNDTSTLLTPEAIENAWKNLLIKSGPFQSIAHSQIEKRSTFYIVLTTCNFQNNQVMIKTVLNHQTKVTGLWLWPITPDSVSQYYYSLPEYANTALFTEIPFAIEQDNLTLPGTLTMPNGDGPFPIAVLIHDMKNPDQNQSKPNSKIFRDIATGLASKGIASLRYDSREKIMDPNTLFETSKTAQTRMIDDVLKAIDQLKTIDKVDSSKMTIIAYGLGGMLAPKIAQQKPEIAGIINMAAMCRPLENVIYVRENTIALKDGTIDPDEKKALNTIFSQSALIRDPDMEKKTKLNELLGWPIEFWLDIRQYHPAVAAKDLTQPMLILQGGMDKEVTTDDYRIWKKYLTDKDNTTFKLYLTLDHQFIDTPPVEPNESTPPQKHHVALEVISDMADWIKAL